LARIAATKATGAILATHRQYFRLAVTILLTWLYNRSGGLLSATIFHAAIKCVPLSAALLTAYP